MKLLTAVNLILPKLGEHPVSRLDMKHPTLAVILPEVENELVQVCTRGWWFNQFEYTAYPDPEGKIKVGLDVISFVPTDGQYASLRGLDLYNPETLNYVFTSAVKGVVTQRIDFDLLPETAAQTVFYNALVNVYVTDIGMSTELQLWGANAKASYAQLLAEHMRQRKYSTRQSARWLRYEAARRA